MSPFHFQHMPVLADDLPRGGPGVLQPVATLALVLAGGAFMAVLALPAYIAALREARANPDLRAAMAAALAADE